MKKNDIFSTSTQTIESVYVPGHTILICKKSTPKPSNIIFVYLIFVFVRKNSDFTEFNVPLIHRKQVPLLHNTVLILCDEGSGLVTVKV